MQTESGYISNFGNTHRLSVVPQIEMDADHGDRPFIASSPSTIVHYQIEEAQPLWSRVIYHIVYKVGSTESFSHFISLVLKRWFWAFLKILRVKMLENLGNADILWKCKDVLSVSNLRADSYFSSVLLNDSICSIWNINVHSTRRQSCEISPYWIRSENKRDSTSAHTSSEETKILCQFLHWNVTKLQQNRFSTGARKQDCDWLNWLSHTLSLIDICMKMHSCNPSYFHVPDEKLHNTSFFQLYSWRLADSNWSNSIPK